MDKIKSALKIAAADIQELETYGNKKEAEHRRYLYSGIIGGMLPIPPLGYHFETIGFFRLLKKDVPALPEAGPVMAEAQV